MGASDSKLQFKQSLYRLQEKHATEYLSDPAFWTAFWELPQNIHDVFGLIAPTDMRTLLSSAPENVVTFVTKCLDLVIATVGLGQRVLTPIEAKHLGNVVRILIRVLPFIFEDQSRDWHQAIFRQPCLLGAGGRLYVHEFACAVIHLLFTPNFTLPSNVTKRKDGTFTTIWAPGIGAKSAPESTYELDVNRTESLNLLLVLISACLYWPASAIRESGITWHAALLDEAKPGLVMATLGSLINVVMHYDPVGFGVPYNYLVFADSKEALAEAALQTLLVLIDNRYPLQEAHVTTPHALDAQAEAPADAAGRRRATSTGTTGSNESAEAVGRAAGGDDSAHTSTHMFQEYFARIHRPEDFMFLVDGMARLLQNPLESNNTYLPGSRKRIKFGSELVVFAWRLVELNKRFLAYLLQDAKLMDFVVSILVTALEASTDDARLGLVHVCAFFLLILSGERNFGVRLNKAYTHRHSMLAVPKSDVTHADVLVYALHRLITEGHRSLFPLYECFLTTIANVAPFIKSLSSSSAQKLLALLRHFTTPRFLLAAPNNNNLSVILLDALNCLTQYQFDGNTRLIYTLLRSADTFAALHEMSLSAAMEKLTAKAPVDEATPAPPPATPPPATPPPAVSEAPAAADGKPDIKPEVKPDVKLTQEPNAHHQKYMAPGMFAPTEEWWHAYKRRLNLAVILRLIGILRPQVERLCVERDLNNEEAVLAYLASGTLVGLLPPPPPLSVRRYRPNVNTFVWATVYLWGIIYLAHLDPPVWYGTAISLFIVKHMEEDE